MPESSPTEPTTTLPEPLPANIRSIQPGGGFGQDIELAWGRWRRRYLRTFRGDYVARMAALRRGSCDGAPHEILDPRDLKYCRVRCDAHWAPEDDPFRWRDRLLLARWGLCELQLFAWPLAALTLWLWTRDSSWWLAPAAALVWVISFFRDPPRQITTEPGFVVSPADGKVVEIAQLAHDEFIGGPAVRIGIFLSIFNVHINRAPVAARVIRLAYSPGKFLNALDPDSALRNENLLIGLEACEAPHRRMVVRQIAGLIARRIVCDLKPGETLARGQKFGMIKFGSRTELTLPASDDLKLSVQIGDRVKGGLSLLARYGERRRPTTLPTGDVG